MYCCTLWSNFKAETFRKIKVEPRRVTYAHLLRAHFNHSSMNNALDKEFFSLH